MSRWEIETSGIPVGKRGTLPEMQGIFLTLYRRNDTMGARYPVLSNTLAGGGNCHTKHVKRSVIPIYLVGVVWLVFGLGLRLYQPVDYILCALVSVAAFVVGKAIFPDKSYQIAGGEDEEEKKQAEQEAQKRAEEAHAAREKAQAEREERQRREQEEKVRQAQQAKSTGNSEIDKLILERERALSEMRRLNDSIEDETISAQIDHLEEVTRKIIDQVIQDPKKLPQIRRFLNYFLPTTLKILNAYDRMDAVGISGENIDATKAKVEAMMGTIVKAFDKQLDSLFGAEAMDISTDITVMENLLAQEGLSGPERPKTSGEGTTLEL